MITLVSSRGFRVCAETLADTTVWRRHGAERRNGVVRSPHDTILFLCVLPFDSCRPVADTPLCLTLRLRSDSQVTEEGIVASPLGKTLLNGSNIAMVSSASGLPPSFPSVWMPGTSGVRPFDRVYGHACCRAAGEGDVGDDIAVGLP